MKISNLPFARILQHFFAAAEIVVTLIVLVNSFWVLRAFFPGTHHSNWTLSGFTLQIDPPAAPHPSPTDLHFNVSSTLDVSTHTPLWTLAQPLRIPTLGMLFCGYLAYIVLCDLFRRVFRSIAQGEVFSLRTIRTLRRVGLLIMALAVVGGLFERSYGIRLQEFIREIHTANFMAPAGIQVIGPGPSPYPSIGFNVDSFGVAVGSHVFRLGWRGILIRVDMDLRQFLLGSVLLGMALALQQGLTIKEENELTV